MQRQPISRAPIVVVVVFGVIATTLIFIGMQRPGEPPPDVDITAAGTPADPRPVTVIMRDYRFDPTPVLDSAQMTVTADEFEPLGCP